MFRRGQLLFLILIISLFSCNSADRQKATAKPSTSKTETIPQLRQENVKPAYKEILIEKINIPDKKNNPSKKTLAYPRFTATTSLADDFKVLEPPFQNFNIDPGIDTTIFCKEGTIIKIKHSSFNIHSTNLEAANQILLQVKEFYKIADILSARLSTTSGGDILETAGMLFIQAFSDGQLCELKNNSPVEVSFPFAERKEDMLLFSGNWTQQNINWEKTGTQVADTDKVIDEMATFPGGTAALNNFLLKNIIYPDSLADMGIGAVVQMDFTIDETGKASVVNFKNPAQKGFKDEIIATFSKMPRWKPAKRNGVPVKSIYSQAIRFYTEELRVPDTIFKNNFEATVSDTNIDKVKTADIRHYIFSTSKLGWINCDRFYNSPKPRTDFYVDCGNYTELDIKLVFHSFRAILDNYASKATNKFKNIPEDEVITVVVVKKINNDTFISLTRSNTSLKSINNLAFEKVTMDKLKEKLEQFNNIR